MGMKIFWIAAVTATTITREQANDYLTRNRRANGFLEELKDGNLKRECFDETCDQHENYEVFDNQENHRESWSKLIACKQKLTSENKSVQKYLRNCYESDTRRLMNPK